jgi:Ca-activated chloride channel homolog
MGSDLKDAGRLIRNVSPQPKRMVLVCALPLLAFIVFSAANAGAQGKAANLAPPKPATSDQTKPAGEKKAPNESIKVNVREVNVTVSVLDKKGLPVIDLTQDDFKVYEDGRLQTIKYFRRDPQPPLRVGLIMDTSNSARRQLQFQKDAATEFAYNLLQSGGTKNQIFLETFDASSSIVQDFTSDPDILNEKIRKLKAGGGKALYDAIYVACRDKMLKAGNPEATRRVLVVISNGVDVQSQHSLDETISMAHKAETLIYMIDNTPYGYANPGEKTMQYITEQTGGAPFFPLADAPGTDLGTGYLSHGQIGDTSQNTGLGASTGIYSAERMVQLADSLDSIRRELDEQYSIGYSPTNDTMDGTYRNIRVVLDRKNVEVRNKVGYFATPLESDSSAPANP